MRGEQVPWDLQGQRGGTGSSIRGGGPRVYNFSEGENHLDLWKGRVCWGAEIEGVSSWEWMTEESTQYWLTRIGEALKVYGQKR